MALLTSFGLLWLLTIIPCVLPDDTCTWPDYFDISVANGSELEELEVNSWETKIRIKKNDQRINGRMKQNVWLTVLSNDTIEMTYNARKRDLKRKTFFSLRYTCVKQAIDSVFKVKVMRGQIDENKTFSETEPPKHKCIEFIKRSPFVLQWRDGPESEDIAECSKGFAPIRPWPLVHFPVRKMPIWETVQKDYGKMIPELLKEYQSCPDLGGYRVRVFDRDGKTVHSGCKNDDPSPRLEFECVQGDGIRLIQSRENCTAYSVLGLGSQLNCLATWEEGRYQFSVVVPSYQSGINSFHCLRINKDDPTKELAVLFLDAICGKGDVVKTKVNNFQLELRKGEFTSVCDDTSDQCDVDQCNSTMQSCLTTCGSCPANDTLPIDESIRGIWVIQQGHVERKMNITEDGVTLFDDGTFHAYSNGSSDLEWCLRDSLTGEGNEVTVRYLLGGVPNKAGCGPRVTTLYAKKISESVLLAQIPQPAPLRANFDNSKLDRWCYNNFNDISRFGQLFRPLYPLQGMSGFFQNTSGYLTLINENNQEPTMCETGDAVKDVSFLATIRGDNSTDLYDCEGNFRSEDEDKAFTLKFTCLDGISMDLKFACLGKYEINTGYQTFVVKMDNGEATEGPISFTQNFYCIIFPKNAGENSTVIIHNAGECDNIFKTLVEMDIYKPMVKLTLGTSSSVRLIAGGITYLSFIVWLMYCTLSCIIM